MEYLFDHFKGEEEFVKKVIGLIRKADGYQMPCLTEFLSPYHQRIVLSLVNHQKDLQVMFEGGIENSEMKRCIIAPSYYKINQEDFEIIIFEVKYASKFSTLTHSDVLGAMMSKGIKRERFGDIVIHDGIFFACDKTISDLLSVELESIKNASVRLEITNRKIESKIEYRVKTFFVSSYRLDTLLANLYHLSRNEVNRYIQSGFVKVNHKVVVENKFLCNNSDVISFKKHGRVRVEFLDRTTKQGNHVIEGYFYK